MVFPSTRTLQITIDGTDRTSFIPISREEAGGFGARILQIDDVLTRIANRASFTVLDGDDISMEGLQDVVISDSGDSTRYFAGLITKLSDRSRGDGLDIDVDCQDYGWYLDHPEVLIDAEYTSQSDQAIIQDFMEDCCPDLDHDTHVDQVLATIDYIRFENETPKRALERLASLAGADFYVDDGPGAGGTKAALHYFASGTNAAPHSLSDSPDYATSFPYSDFNKIDTVPDVNSVEVVGRHESEVRYYADDRDTEQGSLSYSVIGADEAFTDDAQRFFDWMTEAPGTAGYRIIVTNADDTEVWAYIGPCIIDDTEQGNLSYTVEGSDETFTDDGQDFSSYTSDRIIVVENNDGTQCWGYLSTSIAPGHTEIKVFQDEGGATTGWNGDTSDPRGDGKTPSTYNVIDNQSEDFTVYTDLGLTSKGWNGDTSDPRGDGKTPSSYVVWKAEGDYGYWIRHKIVDNDLVTNSQLKQRGDQYLSDVASGVSYKCSTLEPGLRSGQDITVVNSARSLNSSLLIKRVTTTFDSGGYASFDLEMGAHIHRFADVLAGGRNIWDEEKFLPKRPGTIEQVDAGTDVQAKHYLDTYNDQAGYPPMAAMRKSHSDTLGTKTTTVDTEELGYWPIYGVESGGDWQLAGYQKLVQDDAAGAGSIDAHWHIHCNDLSFYLYSKNPGYYSDPSKLVKFVGGGDTNVGLEMTLEVYNDETWNGPYLSFMKSHSNTLGSAAETQDGEELGFISFYGVDTGGNWDFGAYISVDQSGPAGGKVPSVLLIDVFNDTAAKCGMKFDGPNETVTVDATSQIILDITGGAQVTLDNYASIEATDYIKLDVDPGNYILLDSGGYIELDADEYIELDGAEGVGIGATAHPTANPADVLFFQTKSNDPTMATNTAGIYAKDVSASAEMFAIDEAGNAAQLTPHDPETGEWVFFTKNVKTGRVLKVQMEALMKRLDAEFGGGYIEDYVERTQ